MVKLINKATNNLIATISDEQLQFLVDHLEEEGAQDDDYFIDRDVIGFLMEMGADQKLLEALQQALGDKQEVDICWEREH